MYKSSKHINIPYSYYMLNYYVYYAASTTTSLSFHHPAQKCWNHEAVAACSRTLPFQPGIRFLCL